MGEPHAYNNGLGSLFKFERKLRQPFISNGTTSPNGQVPPPLDVYTEDLLIGASLRRLFQGYTGNLIEIANANASANTAIGQDQDGNLDMAQLLSWVAANPPYPIRVRVWYNQNVGFGNLRYINTDITKLPVITDGSGNVYMNNGRPCIKFGYNNLPTYMSTERNLFNSKYIVASDIVQNAGIQFIVHYPGSETLSNISARGTTFLGFTGSTLTSSESLSSTTTAGSVASISPPTRALIHSQHNTSTLLTDLYYNGAFIPSGSTISVVQNTSVSYMHIGCNVSGDATSSIGSAFYTGNLQEVIVYSQPREEYRVGLTANIRQYWGL